MFITNKIVYFKMMQFSLGIRN